MKKVILLLAATLLFYGHSFAQSAVWKTEGVDIIPNFTMKDINNVAHPLYATTGQGKHMIIDFSATWCSPCWNYHSSHVLQHYYESYGATGTVQQDAEVIFYEVDNTTNNLTTSSLGDWTLGVTHPICDDNVASNPVSNFMSSGGSYGIPKVVVVCKNNTYYSISTSNTDPVVLRNYIESKCGIAPLSTSSIQDIGFDYDVYPNPSNQNLNLDLNLDKNEMVSYSLSNFVGQTVASKDGMQLAQGLNKVSINTSSLTEGLYFLNLRVGTRKISTKVVVAH